MYRWLNSHDIVLQQSPCYALIMPNASRADHHSVRAPQGHRTAVPIVKLMWFIFLIIHNRSVIKWWHPQCMLSCGMKSWSKCSQSICCKSLHRDCAEYQRRSTNMAIEDGHCAQQVTYVLIKTVTLYFYELVNGDQCLSGEHSFSCHLLNGGCTQSIHQLTPIEA